jgi:hypothetical protein
MTPVPTPGAEAAALDFRKSLLESFAINEKGNQLLLSHIADAAWQAPPPSGKGRSSADIASHIHHVRLMWLSAADKTAKHPARFDPEQATRPLARQVGHPVPTKTGFGLWEWGNLWRESGFGK